MGAGGFEALVQAGAANAQRQQEFNLAQKKQARDEFIGLQKNVLDNPNNSLNDPALNDIKDPLARDAEVKRRTAVRQEALNKIISAHAPNEGGSLLRVIHGLVHGAPVAENNATTIANTPPAPSPDPNAPPPAPVVKDLLGIPISDPAVAAAHQEPMHPMQTDHPIITRFHEALGALGSHLQAAGKGFQAKPQTFDTSNVAANYASPTTTARETSDLAAQHQQDLAQKKGEQAIDLEKERRQRYEMMLPEEKQVMAKYAHDNGYASVLQIPTDEREHILAQFNQKTKPKLTTAIVVDPDSSTGFSKVTMDQFSNEVTSTIPGITPPRGFVPTLRRASSTDQYGNTTSSVATVTPQVPGGNAPAVGANAPAKPPVSKNAPQLPSGGGVPQADAAALADINAKIKANQGKAAPGVGNRKAVAATPSGPVSSKAPKGAPILDENDQIPAGAAPNPQIRQFAQDLLDDQDTLKIPAKARAAAEQVARQFGWSQGAFTPREQRAINLTGDFLDKFADSPSLKILDDPFLRAQAVAALHHAQGMVGEQLQAFTSSIEDPRVAEFVRLYNANVNNVTGASSTIRPGRPTEALVKRLGTELPTVLQSKDSADAKQRIKLLQAAIKDAQKSSRLKGVGSSTPSGQQKPQNLTDRLNEALGK